MKNTAFRLLFALSLLATTACSVPEEGPKALVSVLLVDAPASWDSVVVEVLGVSLEFVPSGRQGEVQTLDLPYEPADKSINLSKLVNGAALPVARKEVALGKITAITLKLGTSHALYQGDKRFPLTLATGTTSFPQALDLNLEPGISYDLVLDVDLEQSIRVLKESPLELSFTPAIKAYQTLGRGIISGIISPKELRPAIYAIQGRDSLSTHTDASGGFVLSLPPGQYTLYIDPKDSRYKAETLVNVPVNAGQRSSLAPLTLLRK